MSRDELNITKSAENMAGFEHRRRCLALADDVADRDLGIRLFLNPIQVETARPPIVASQVEVSANSAVPAETSYPTPSETPYVPLPYNYAGETTYNLDSEISNGTGDMAKAARQAIDGIHEDISIESQGQSS